MARFREGGIVYLVATDVVGRGIDVQNISHIFNYDMPEDPENYVHRIGRTGRMGSDGIAISLVTPDQGELLTAIETYINSQIPEEKLEGFVAFVPRTSKVAQQAVKPYIPVFGDKIRKYSKRL
jgi:ATP-dependent RNA helicase DeaD